MIARRHRFAWLAVLVALAGGVQDGSANGGPTIRAYDYALTFAGDDEEGDYIWRYGFTMCTSHAARVKVRFVVGSNRGNSFSVFYLDKRRAGCKRYRMSFDQTVHRVRARVRLWWRGSRVIAPWREGTCEPRCP